MAPSSGIRFFDDITAEPPTVQEAISQMIADLKVEREEDERRLAAAKASAVDAVESAIAAHQDPPSRLAS